MTRKKLIERLFSSAARLARGLLRARRRIVADTLLYALVIYGVGCIVPTPLDPQVQPPNYPPVIFSATPPFGPITRADLPFDLKIWVTDPDDNQLGTLDKLHAKLFFLNPTLGPNGTLEPATNEDIPLTLVVPPDPNNPTLAAGSFPMEALCARRSGQTQYLYVIVADRPFVDGGPQVVAGGGSTENYWVLTCS